MNTTLRGVAPIATLKLLGHKVLGCKSITGGQEWHQNRINGSPTGTGSISISASGKLEPGMSSNIDIDNILTYLILQH